MLQVLISSGADVNATLPSRSGCPGISPLMMAVKMKAPDALQMLFKSKVRTRRDVWQLTVDKLEAQYSCFKPDMISKPKIMECVEVFLNAGVSIRGIDMALDLHQRGFQVIKQTQPGGQGVFQVVLSDEASSLAAAAAAAAAAKVHRRQQPARAAVRCSALHAAIALGICDPSKS